MIVHLASGTGFAMTIVMANDLSYNGLRPGPTCRWARNHRPWPTRRWTLELDTTTFERSLTRSAELRCRLQHTERAARHLTPRKSSVRRPISFPASLYVPLYLTETNSRRHISSVHLPVACHRALVGRHPRSYWSGRVCLSQSSDRQLDS